MLCPCVGFPLRSAGECPSSTTPVPSRGRSGVRWPTPAAGELRLIERLDALHELARLREAGELSASAAVRLAFVLDPARAAEPPADLAAWFGQGPGPVGLRAARACLVTTAPTFWRLAGGEFDRLVDRLDPAAP